MLETLIMKKEKLNIWPKTTLSCWCGLCTLVLLPHVIAFNLNLETTLKVINVHVDVLLWNGCSLDVLSFMTICDIDLLLTCDLGSSERKTDGQNDETDNFAFNWLPIWDFIQYDKIKGPAPHYCWDKDLNNTCLKSLLDLVITLLVVCRYWCCRGKNS